MYVVFLVCYLPISCVVFAKTKGKMALFSHLWYFTLTRLVYWHNTYKIADKSASILITNQILHPFKQSALAIPMIKHVLKMTETHEVKSHLKSASFSIDEGRTSRLSSYYRISNHKTSIPKWPKYLANALTYLFIPNYWRGQARSLSHATI